MKNIVLATLLIVVAAGSWICGDATGDARVTERWRQKTDKNRSEVEALRAALRAARIDVKADLPTEQEEEYLLLRGKLRDLAAKLALLNRLEGVKAAQPTRERLEEEVGQGIANLLIQEFPELFRKLVIPKEQPSDF